MACPKCDGTKLVMVRDRRHTWIEDCDWCAEKAAKKARRSAEPKLPTVTK